MVIAAATRAAAVRIVIGRVVRPIDGGRVAVVRIRIVRHVARHVRLDVVAIVADRAALARTRLAHVRRAADQRWRRIEVQLTIDSGRRRRCRAVLMLLRYWAATGRVGFRRSADVRRWRLSGWGQECG